MNSDAPSPSYRQIAHLTGLSIFSISCALRNRPGVSEKTRAYIRQVAEEAGYRPNPMVTALMTQHRTRSPRRRLRAIIACLMPAQVDKGVGTHSTPRAFFDGLRIACEEAGFLLEKFHWEDFGDSPKRLFACLRARRVPGVVFYGDVPAWCRTGWDNYAMTSVGAPQKTRLHHYTGADHHNNMWLAMDTLAGLDYLRIGFAMTKSWGEGNNHQPLSSYQGWTTRSEITDPPPPFWTDTWERKTFLAWVKRHRPDVVIAAQHEPLEFLRGAGFSIPRDIGFVHLDLDDTWNAIAGIRQNALQVGEATAHHVIDQINRNSYGIPTHPRSVQVTGEWFAGPTVKKQPPAIRSTGAKGAKKSVRKPAG